MKLGLHSVFLCDSVFCGPHCRAAQANSHDLPVLFTISIVVLIHINLSFCHQGRNHANLAIFDNQAEKEHKKSLNELEKQLTAATKLVTKEEHALQKSTEKLEELLHEKIENKKVCSDVTDCSSTFVGP